MDSPHYSIRWERLGGTRRRNMDTIQVTFLDERGRERVVTAFYENWIGVCTRRIEAVVASLRLHFPNHRVVIQRVGDVRKILPYFQERLARGKLNSASKPFYKVYTSACIQSVGRFFNRYKWSYYEPKDWSTRLYIDLCTRYDTHSFYYRWYRLRDSPRLLDALEMMPDSVPKKGAPDWTFAAFDLETVSLRGHHVPMGHVPTDRIVMISLCTWNRRDGVRKRLLYLLPESIEEPLSGHPDGFRTERDLLIRFHQLLDDVQVVTGYNINAFDFPCLLARLLWLNLNRVLRHYTSCNVGTDVVVSYKRKMTLDLYTYVKHFSDYDLPSLKLDDVARVKLDGLAKLQVKATGLWSWYRCASLPRDLFESDDAERCFRVLKPDTVSRPSEFGTFRQYCDYCLRDSELVYRLFEKEWVLSFLVERANLTALNAVEALHLGNSRYLLELFKTYGTRLGFFVNTRFFNWDPSKSQELLGQQTTYQGALNFCLPQTVYEDVSILDFVSMYPSTLRSQNLCYGTCAVLNRDEWLAVPPELRRTLVAIPYRMHSATDFRSDAPPQEETSGAAAFAYPEWDLRKDAFGLVVSLDSEAFLPRIVGHFIETRKAHQRQWAETGDVYHYNVQLGIKILINSLYGVMANRDSPLAYLPIAIIIVTLSRYQLLGSFHFLKNGGYDVCYADTDSLMVHRWPDDHCDRINAFLALPHVELKFEKRTRRLLVLSKKRYVYEDAGGGKVSKGFQKRVNGLIAFMTRAFLEAAWNTLFFGPEQEEASLSSAGWCLWVETIAAAHYMCRDPKKYSLYRKIKSLESYKSATCPAVKFLKKYPDRADEHVEFTYGRADVAEREASNWVMDAEDCRWVNFERLFVHQKKMFCTLLNMAYWRLPDPTRLTDMVLNTLNWKRFVHAELLHWHATGRRLLLLVEPGVRYTFAINHHVLRECRRGPKRKICLGNLAGEATQKKRRRDATLGKKSA